MLPLQTLRIDEELYHESKLTSLLGYQTASKQKPSGTCFFYPSGSVVM